MEPHAQPSPKLKALDRLVGRWRVSGPDIDGQVTYEWMEGGFFLIQQVDFVHGGRQIKGKHGYRADRIGKAGILTGWAGSGACSTPPRTCATASCRWKSAVAT